MINAKQELIDHIDDREVKYVSVTFGESYSETPKHIEGTLPEVLSQLDFCYDNGYGEQELYGTIWYKDGTWSVRDEYGGSEWWSHRKCPELPEAQVGLDKTRPEVEQMRAEVESLTRSLTIVAGWENVNRTYTANELKEFAQGILAAAKREAAERGK